MYNLTTDEADAIGEVFNIAMGQAANALSSLVNSEVKLSIPSLDLLPLHAVAELFSQSNDTSICAVHEKFGGPFSGNALLIFPEVNSLELVQAILGNGDDIAIESLSELEEEALVEIGNIILNACLAGIANLFGTTITTEIPVCHKGTIDDILTSANANEVADYLFLRMQFEIEIKSMCGYVAFIMDINSMGTFKKLLKEVFQLEDD